MKHPVLIVAAAMLALSTSPPRQQEPDFAKLTPAQWRADLRYFARELPKRHKNAYHFSTREQIDKAIGDLDADIPKLAPHQIIVRLMQITSMVGDGHTGVHLPASFKHYPIGLYWYDGELRVASTMPEYRQILGGRVESVDGVPLADIMTRLRTVMSQDENEWMVLNASPLMLPRPEVLHTLGVAKDIAHATFTVTQEDGSHASADLTPVALTGNTLRLSASAATSVAFFRRRASEQFWFEMLPDSQTAYVNFKSYDDLANNVQKLFTFVDAHHATKLLIDLRQNGGGDFLKGRSAWLPAIKRRVALNTKGHLFVAIGRRTFSAAMVNAIDFRKETNAMLVGEPIGEKPNSYSENDEMTLPNSKIVISYSTQYYKFIDQGENMVTPDQQIDFSWSDFKAGRDPVVDWVMAYKRS